MSPVRRRPEARSRPLTRLTAHDFDQELLILFDACVHRGIDRRTFLDRAAKLARKRTLAFVNRRVRAG